MVTKGYRHQSTFCRIHAGDSVLYKLTEEMARLRCDKAMIVCGRTVSHKTNLLTLVRGVLGDKLIGVFDGVQSGSPSTSSLFCWRKAGHYRTIQPNTPLVSNL